MRCSMVHGIDTTELLSGCSQFRQNHLWCLCIPPPAVVHFTIYDALPVRLCVVFSIIPRLTVGLERSDHDLVHMGIRRWLRVI